MGFKLTCGECGKTKRFRNEEQVVRKGWTTKPNRYGPATWVCSDCKPDCKGEKE